MTGVASDSLICSSSVGQPGCVRDDFVAGAEQAHRRVVERLLPTRRDDHVRRRVVDAIVRAIPVADRLFELLRAGVGRVFGEIGVDRCCAAAEMCGGVGKSGSPAPKSTTSTPCAFKRCASAATFMVGRHGHSSGADRRACVYALGFVPASCLSRSRSSSTRGTRPPTVPPSATTSLTSRELT